MTTADEWKTGLALGDATGALKEELCSLDDSVAEVEEQFERLFNVLPILEGGKLPPYHPPCPELGHFALGLDLTMIQSLRASATPSESLPSTCQI